MKGNEIALSESKGTKKTKSILMILAAILVTAKDHETVRTFSKHVEKLSDKLEAAPAGDAEKYWNKGAAFGLAMEHSRRIVKEFPLGNRGLKEAKWRGSNLIKAWPIIPRLFKLSSLTGYDLDKCLAKMHRLWWWALTYAEDGDLKRLILKRLALAWELKTP